MTEIQRLQKERDSEVKIPDRRHVILDVELSSGPRQFPADTIRRVDVPRATIAAAGTTPAPYTETMMIIS